MKIVVEENATFPTRANPHDAGLDLCATESGWVHPGEHKMFGTGVHVQIPSNHVGLLTSKSGLMKNGITSRGTIDCGYTGEIKAILFNHSSKGYLVNKGDKITQLVVLPIKIPELEFVTELEDTERGEKGFGSSGR